MLKGMRNFVVVASCLGAAVACVQVAAAQGSATTGHSITDSPYANGPPAITGGYTDTSQGGKKTSGDPQALPPSAAMRGQQQSSDSQQQGEGQKSPDSGSGH
jgi:hypothetical protein